ncbi:MAG: type II secretion system protein [Armatimonadota bacterium]
MSHRHQGFTLIELLVVIAIIVLLAGILFPVISKARDKARMVTCLSNQRQVSLAMVMYTQEHDERLPLASEFWKEVKLGPGITNCPTQGPGVNGYVYNIYLSGVSLGKVLRPDKTMVTVDGKVDSGVDPDPSDPYSPNSITGSPLTSVCYLPEDADPRHTGKFVASYLDGHSALTITSPPMDVEWDSPATNATITYNGYDADAPHTGSTVKVTVVDDCRNWNTKVVSKVGLGANGMVSFRFADNSTYAAVGIGASDCASVTALNFAIYGKNGTLRFIEGGETDIAPTAAMDSVYFATDEFAIERDGLTINYLKKGRIIRSSKISSDPGAMFVYAWFNAYPGEFDVPGVTNAIFMGTQ